MDHDQSLDPPAYSRNQDWAIDHIAASLTALSGIGVQAGRRHDDDPSPNLSRYHLELLVNHSPFVTEVALSFIVRALTALHGADALPRDDVRAVARQILEVEARGIGSGRRLVAKKDFLEAYHSGNRHKRLAALLYRSIIESIWDDARRASSHQQAGPDHGAAGQGQVGP